LTAGFLLSGISLALSFDYAAKNAAPLRKKYLLAERLAAGFSLSKLPNY